MSQEKVIKFKGNYLWIMAIVALIAASMLIVFLLHRLNYLPIRSTADAPYQLQALPTQSPTQNLPPGMILIPAQITGPGELLIPSRGVVYIATNTPGMVYAQSYENVEVHRTRGYAQPIIKEKVVYVNGEPRTVRQSGGLTRGEKGAIIGGVIGAGTGAIIGKQSGKTAQGAAIGGLIGALTGGVIGHSQENR